MLIFAQTLQFLKFSEASEKILVPWLYMFQKFTLLKHHIPGSTMLLTFNLINKTSQASLNSNLDPSHKPSSGILFHTYLPAVSFWPSCCWSLYPPSSKLVDHLAHLPGHALSPTLQASFPSHNLPDLPTQQCYELPGFRTHSFSMCHLLRC